VEIPVLEAAEMTPIDPSVGEFRVHYAGFFDPGFGAAETDSVGSRGVLEVRSHETPFLLEDGQTVARLVYEPLTERPTRLYGENGSHYQRQGLKLSKHFRFWEWRRRRSLLRTARRRRGARCRGSMAARARLNIRRAGICLWYPWGVCSSTETCRRGR
jgi:hypothetical protein